MKVAAEKYSPEVIESLRVDAKVSGFLKKIENEYRLFFLKKMQKKLINNSLQVANIG